MRPLSLIQSLPTQGKQKPSHPNCMKKHLVGLLWSYKSRELKVALEIKCFKNRLGKVCSVTDATLMLFISGNLRLIFAKYLFSQLACILSVFLEVWRFRYSKKISEFLKRRRYFKYSSQSNYLYATRLFLTTIYMIVCASIIW